MIGVAWGAIYVGVPSITSILAPQPILLIPIPWIDLTRAVQAFLPGALFGKGYSLDRLCYSFYVGNSGIFGTSLGVAVTIIITYIIFGGL